jgi:hypothetical protein
MTLKEDSWGNDCRIVQCLIVRVLDFCHECSEYVRSSCEKFEELAKGYLTDEQVDIRANLERIKKGEVEKWPRESEEKYKCPSYGRSLSLGSKWRKCCHCGTDFSG